MALARCILHGQISIRIVDGDMANILIGCKSTADGWSSVNLSACRETREKVWNVCDGNLGSNIKVVSIYSFNVTADSWSGRLDITMTVRCEPNASVDL